MSVSSRSCSTTPQQVDTTSSGRTNHFDIVTGVWLSSILLSLIYAVVVDFEMKKTVTGANLSLKWGGGRLADLDFADNLALFSHTYSALREITSNLHEHGEKVMLYIIQEKTKALTVEKSPKPFTTHFR